MFIACYSSLCNPQECHTKAWDIVTSYMESNMRVFSGKSDQAESVIMPAVASWLQETLQEVPEVRGTDDHAVVIWLCLPTAGIVSANKWDFFITLVSNFLARYNRNGLALIVHANRAGQMNGSRSSAVLLCAALLILLP